MSFVQSLRDRTVVDPESGCWLWVGYVSKDNGYGYFGKKRAHRWVWTNMVGSLTKKEHLDHTCETKNCVNPEHLQITDAASHNRRHKTGKKMNLSDAERQRRSEHGRKMIHNASSRSYTNRTRSEVTKAAWDKRSPEEREEIGMKISLAKRGDA